jgi:hypothetical protein
MMLLGLDHAEFHRCPTEVSMVKRFMTFSRSNLINGPFYIRLHCLYSVVRTLGDRRRSVQAGANLNAPKLI